MTAKLYAFILNIMFQCRCRVSRRPPKPVTNLKKLTVVLFPPAHVVINLVIALGVNHSVWAKQTSITYQLRADGWQAPETSYQPLGSGTLKWTKNTYISSGSWKVETRLDADLKLPSCNRVQTDCQLDYTSFRSLPELIYILGCDLHIHEYNRQTSSGNACSEMTLFWNNRQCHTSHYAWRNTPSYDIHSNLRYVNGGVSNISLILMLPQNPHLDGFPVKMSHLTFGFHPYRIREVWVPMLQLFNIQGLSPVQVASQPNKIFVSAIAHPAVFEYHFEDISGRRSPIYWGTYTPNNGLFFVVENNESEEPLSQETHTEETIIQDTDITPHISLSQSSSNPDPETPKDKHSDSESFFLNQFATIAFVSLIKYSLRTLLHHIANNEKNHTKRLSSVYLTAQIMIFLLSL